VNYSAPSRDFNIIRPIHNQEINCVQDTSIHVQEHEYEKEHIDKKKHAKKEKKNSRDASCDAKLVMKIKAKDVLFSLTLIIIVVTPTKFNKL
jgi:hypothetical protein